MNIVNIGTDKTLVGGPKLGDAVERHARYGEFVENLDIIVYTNKSENLRTFSLSENVTGHPTNSLSKVFFYIDAISEFKKIYTKNRVDIVVCQDPFLPGLAGLAIKKKYGVKLQVNFHGDFWDNPAWLEERWINRLFLKISKFVVPRADAVRVMSEGQKNKLILEGIDPEKIFVISTPIDMKKFLKAVRPAGQEAEHSLPVIMHVSRPDNNTKDFETLFKAVSEAYKKKRFFFRQVGAGFSQETLKERYPDISTEFLADKNYMFLGNTEPEKLLSLYNSSDVIILTSTSESFGKVLVEANACGKPIVSTATTGAKDIIQDGLNGFLVPVKDSRALADKIVYLLNNPNKAQEMGERGRSMVKERYGDNTEKIVRLWRNILNT